MILPSLIGLGLPKNTTIVLDVLVAVDEVKATDVIRKTGLHRHLVYEALRDLERRGLVKKLTRNGVAIFRFISIDPLLIEAETRFETTQSIAQALRSKQKNTESAVQFFEGVEGIHTFTELVLSTAQPLRVLGANTRFRQYFPEVFDLWNEKRERLGVAFQALMSKDIPEALLCGVPGFTFRHTGLPLSPAVTWIFGEYVAFIFWKTRRDSEIILLRHPSLAQQFRNYFDELWKGSKS